MVLTNTRPGAIIIKRRERGQQKQPTAVTK